MEYSNENCFWAKFSYLCFPAHEAVSGLPWIPSVTIYRSDNTSRAPLSFLSWVYAKARHLSAVIRDVIVIIAEYLPHTIVLYTLRYGS